MLPCYNVEVLVHSKVAIFIYVFFLFQIIYYLYAGAAQIHGSTIICEFSRDVLNQLPIAQSLTQFPYIQWRHNEHDGISNHQHLDCLLNRLFRCRSKETLKLCITGHYMWIFTRCSQSTPNSSISHSIPIQHDGISNHQRLDCLLNRLFRCKSKKTLQLCITGHYMWIFSRCSQSTPNSSISHSSPIHYSDVIMSMIASQITSVLIV